MECFLVLFLLTLCWRYNRFVLNTSVLSSQTINVNDSYGPFTTAISWTNATAIVWTIAILFLLKNRNSSKIGSLYILPPANEICEGYVFTGVCLSTGGVCSGGGSALGGCLLPGVFRGGGGRCLVEAPKTFFFCIFFVFLFCIFFLLFFHHTHTHTHHGQWAGGTHPTGMHSCCNYDYDSNSLHRKESQSPTQSQ